MVKLQKKFFIVPKNCYRGRNLKPLFHIYSGCGGPKMSHNWLYMACTFIYVPNEAASVINPTKI